MKIKKSRLALNRFYCYSGDKMIATIFYKPNYSQRGIWFIDYHDGAPFDCGNTFKICEKMVNRKIQEGLPNG